MVSKAAPGLVLGGRYRLVQPLARGGMASVWVAEDTLLGRKVAVKTLHPELSVDEALRTRFRREAIAAASLAHPAIVTTYDTGEHDGIAFIVMELVEGPTLRRLMDDQGRMEVADAVRIGRWVAAALEHAHRNGIVHRDIKPANVLVPPEGAVKVTDFGIAKSDGVSDLTRTGTVVGTARYLAPEQVRGDPVDARADIYALGLVLYEMLAGTLPFHGDTEMSTALARLTTSPQPLYEARPDLPPALDRVVAHCLTLDPDHRYPSGAALAAALDDVSNDEAPALPPPTPPPSGATSPAVATTPPAQQARSATQQEHPPRRRSGAGRFFLVLLALLVFAGGAVAGYLALSNATDDPGTNGSGGTGVAGAVQIAEAQAFDPPPGDRSENGELAPNAIDGNPQTAWETEHYNSRNLGGIKPGVGIVLKLAETAEVSSVEIDALDSGWSAEIYVGDGSADDLDGWGSPVGSVEDAGTSATVDLSASEADAVLVWITRLPSSGKLRLAEVRVG